MPDAYLGMNRSRRIARVAEDEHARLVRQGAPQLLRCQQKLFLDEERKQEDEWRAQASKQASKQACVWHVFGMCLAQSRACGRRKFEALPPRTMRESGSHDKAETRAGGGLISKITAVNGRRDKRHAIPEGAAANAYL